MINRRAFLLGTTAAVASAALPVGAAPVYRFNEAYCFTERRVVISLPALIEWSRQESPDGW